MHHRHEKILNLFSSAKDHCLMGVLFNYYEQILRGTKEKSFTLVIQRKRIKGQVDINLDADNTGEGISSQGYIYRTIATNQDDWGDSKIIHWYNQRAEDNENRIKELKLDFGGDTLPCSDFNADALYFLLSTLSYNLFALMRQLLPDRISTPQGNHFALALICHGSKGCQKKSAVVCEITDKKPTPIRTSASNTEGV